MDFAGAHTSFNTVEFRQILKSETGELSDCFCGLGMNRPYFLGKGESRVQKQTISAIKAF